MNWNDLALDERLAVEEVAHGPQLLMSVEMADRLRILRLVDDDPAGLVLSDVGAWVYAERRTHDRARRHQNRRDSVTHPSERDSGSMVGIEDTGSSS